MARVIKNASGYVSHGRTAGEKAANFGEWAKQNGWSGTMNEEDGRLHLFARRGEVETIDIWWFLNGSLDTSRLPMYTLAGEPIKLRNVSAAAKVAASEPDTSRLRKAARKQRRQLDGATNVAPEDIDSYIAGMQGSLPFDHESTDEEIKVALKGRTISWINRRSGEVHSATVSDSPKHFKVVRNGHDYIDFVYPVPRRTAIETYGFRAVYLDSIVSVA